MSLDITPLVPAGRQVIQSYGSGRFLISDVEYSGPVLVFPERSLEWGVGPLAELAPESFADIIGSEPKTEILLLGCGARISLPPAKVKSELSAAGIVVEPMDTGAACRTFNVLMGEDRRVAAALFPVA